MSDRGYRQLEHTADLALEIWAEDEPALLAEAALAVVDVLADGARVLPRDERQVELREAFDPEDRLVQWMNQVMLLATVDGFLLAEAEVTLHEDTGLYARLRGEEGARERLVTELKAVTYHDLFLERRPEGARARVVIDV